LKLKRNHKSRFRHVVRAPLFKATFLGVFYPFKSPFYCLISYQLDVTILECLKIIILECLKIIYYLLDATILKL
jgi:hypothetical protein